MTTSQQTFHGPLACLDDGRCIREQLADDALGFAREIHDLRRRCGAVLLRGLQFSDPKGLERIAKRICRESSLLMYEGERATPRTALGGFVYSSTEYEKSGRIFVHNECSSRLSWPLVLMFACAKPAHTGGATPLCDIRTVSRILDGGIQREFCKRGIQYTRNYGAEFGVSIEYAFGTTDRAEVDKYCEANDIATQWNDNASLTTRFRRSSHAVHPETGEDLWFNYATFYSRVTLEPRMRRLLRGVSDSSLAFSAAYGDGEPVPESVFDACREAYETAIYRFEWRQGDLLLLDNMLCAHGRDSFEGARETYVVMADEVVRPQPMSAGTRLVTEPMPGEVEEIRA